MPGELGVEIENAAPEVLKGAEAKEEVANAKEEVANAKEEVASIKEEVAKAEEVAENAKEEVTKADEVVEDIKEEEEEVKRPVEEVVANNKEVEVEVAKPREEVAAQPAVHVAAEKPPEPVVQQNGTPKKVPMGTSLDTNAVRAAYDDVRSDSSETQWAVFKFEGPRVVCSATGAEFGKFKEQFTEDERAFGYIRIQTGDEMSKRQKFVFITWVGSSVSVLKRAKMSTDKAVVKNLISNFAVELQIENPSEIDVGHFVEELNKAGGANYGTGVRDI